MGGTLFLGLISESHFLSFIKPGFIITLTGCFQLGDVRHGHKKLCGGGGSWWSADPRVQPERQYLCSDCGGEA